MKIKRLVRVSVPYEITLLSNQVLWRVDYRRVSVPYEITLLSNANVDDYLVPSVSVPYEITLLSNEFLILLQS